MEETKNRSNHLLNSSLGLLPWLLFVTLKNNISYTNTVVITGLFWVVLFAYFCKIRENQTACILLKVVGVVLMINALALLFYIPEDYTTLFSEALLFIFLLVFNRFKQKISRHYLRYESSYSKREKGMSFNGLFYIVKISQSALFVYLIIASIYLLIPENLHTRFFDILIYEYLGVFFLLMIILYEHTRLSVIKKKLNKESWLPVANETGRIIGKVAKSVSLASGNRFLHPIVRIALIYKGMLFLSERPKNYIVNPGKLDYPFEKRLEFDQTLDDAVGKLTQHITDTENVKTRFAFKHLYKNASASRLVYLYIIPIHDEAVFDKMQLPQGRTWTEKQIDDNLQKGIFSELFETEYEILRNTILMAEKLIYEKQA